jgi:hypothetical protein
MALDISYKNNFHSLTLKNTIYKLKEKYKGLGFHRHKRKTWKEKKNWGTNFSTTEFEGGVTKMGSLYYKLHINLQGSLLTQEAKQSIELVLSHFSTLQRDKYFKNTSIFAISCIY